MIAIRLADNDDPQWIHFQPSKPLLLQWHKLHKKQFHGHSNVVSWNWKFQYINCWHWPQFGLVRLLPYSAASPASAAVQWSCCHSTLTPHINYQRISGAIHNHWQESINGIRTIRLSLLYALLTTFVPTYQNRRIGVEHGATLKEQVCLQIIAHDIKKERTRPSKNTESSILVVARMLLKFPQIINNSEWTWTWVMLLPLILPQFGSAT